MWTVNVILIMSVMLITVSRVLLISGQENKNNNNKKKNLAGKGRGKVNVFLVMFIQHWLILSLCVHCNQDSKHLVS